MTSMGSYRLPNMIVAVRVILAFVSAGLLASGTAATAVVGVGLVPFVLALDALDGAVARRLGVASRLGGVLDITADRIVEHVLWITFAVVHLVGLWVPLVVATRSLVVDAARGLALAHGRTAFGAETMARSRLTRFLTASRLMRDAYGVAKLAAFVLLGVQLAARRAGVDVVLVESAAHVAVLLAVSLCLLRGLPVLLDARAYLPDPARPH